MTKIVALIPARSGSKGIKNKNIIELGGKPLLLWSIAACLKSKLIDRIIVSTDSIEYAEMATSAGAECPFLRPKQISTDNSTDTEFVLHALNFFKREKGIPKFLVHIRPTTPFRNPKIIDDGIKKMLNSSDATSLRSVNEMPETAYKCFEIGPMGNLQIVGSKNPNCDLANGPRQKYTKTYIGNGYVDVLKSEHVLAEKKAHGNRVVPFFTPPTVMVDTQEEFEFLEFLLNRDKSAYDMLFP